MKEPDPLRKYAESAKLVRMKPTGAPFDAAEDATLKRLHKKLTVNQLAEKLERPAMSIQSRLRHLGLRKRDGEAKAQKRVTIFFDLDLLPAIKDGMKAAGLSLTAFVQECVRGALKGRVCK